MRSDFAWLSARMVVGLGGDSHETDCGRLHDERRDALLKRQGFSVLRFDDLQVPDGPDYVVETIKRCLPMLARDAE